MIPLFFPSVLKIPAQEDDLSYHPAAPGAIHNHPNAECGMGNAELFFGKWIFHNFLIPHSGYD